MRFLALLIAAYTYTITMGDSEEAIYVACNLVAMIAWIVLGFLVLSVQRRYHHIVFTWVRPLTLSLIAYAGLSSLRYAANVLRVVYPWADFARALLYTLTVMALATAVGYMLVYYKRIPNFVARVGQHKASARRFAVLAEVAVDGFIELDGEGNIWWANASAARLLGEPEVQKLWGETFSRYLVGDGHVFAKFLVPPGEDVATHPLPICVRRRDETTFPAEITVTPFTLAGVWRYTVILRDISYRSALEACVIEANKHAASV